MTKKVEPSMTRDTDILNGTLTFEDRRKIDKEWARAIKLGVRGLLAKEQPRKKKK
jgi:hypothetical protein